MSDPSAGHGGGARLLVGDVALPGAASEGLRLLST